MAAIPHQAGVLDPLELVRAYAAAGLRVFPLHSMHGGRCTCGTDDCKSAAKHPRTARGVLEATTDHATIDAWARRWPGCNWGMALDGLVVIDCDPRNGGDTTASIIEQQHGAWPDTATARTGGGGWHRLYRTRDGITYTGNKLGPGIDTKTGAGAYIVVEPSIHASGKPYEWIDGTDPYLVPPAIAPDWLGHRAGSRPPPDSASVHLTDDVLIDVRSALSAFDPNEYDDWILVGHCLKHVAGGFELWDQWSRGSPKYGDGNRDPAQVWTSIDPTRTTYKGLFAHAQKRGWINPKARARQQEIAANAVKARADDPRTVIILRPGHRHEALTAIDEVLAATGRVFIRGQRVVHVSHSATKLHGVEVPEHVPHIADATPGWVATQVGRLARLERPNKDGELKLTDCSRELAAFYCDLREWQLPPIRGIASTPLLLPDGAINTANGYDEHSGLWVDWRGGALDVPTNPTRADALIALQRLYKLIETFPFDDPKMDGTIALAALMAAALRPSLDRCPAFAMVSPTAGTGKTKLCKTVAALADTAPPLPLTFGHSEEEFQKALATAVMISPPVALIDNINADGLNSNILAVAISEGAAQIRRFGSNTEAANVECSSLFLLTGNNLWLADDMLRRVLVCSLDPRVEHPELRTFGADPEAHARAHRAEYLRDVHIIVRAFRRWGVTITAQPLAGFDSFCKMIRDPLVWLGQPDLVDKVVLLKDTNPKRASEAELLAALYEEFGKRRFAASDVYAKTGPDGLSGNATLRACVEEVCPNKVSAKAIGRAFLRIKHRVIGGHRLREHPRSGDRSLQYSIECIEDSAFG
jgi:putative DNA primase/helicase